MSPDCDQHLRPAHKVTEHNSCIIKNHCILIPDSDSAVLFGEFGDGTDGETGARARAHACRAHSFSPSRRPFCWPHLRLRWPSDKASHALSMGQAQAWVVANRGVVSVSGAHVCRVPAPSSFWCFTCISSLSPCSARGGGSFLQRVAEASDLSAWGAVGGLQWPHDQARADRSHGIRGGGS